MDRFITVPAPASHDGVGRALRSAYHPMRSALPDDMMALLNKLN